MIQVKVKQLLILSTLLVVLFCSCDLLDPYSMNNFVDEIYSERIGALGIEIGDDITKVKYLKGHITETKEYSIDGQSFKIQLSGTIHAKKSNSPYDMMIVQSDYDSNTISRITLFRRNIFRITEGEFRFRVFEKFGNDCGGQFFTRGIERWPDGYWIYWNGYVDNIKVSVEYYQSPTYNLMGPGYNSEPSITMRFGSHSFDY